MYQYFLYEAQIFTILQLCSMFTSQSLVQFLNVCEEENNKSEFKIYLMFKEF